MINPYQILGISPNASDAEIKKAYRNLSRRYHPDANVNNPNREAAEEKFKEIQAAYNQIMDERQNGGNFSNNNYNYHQSNYSYSESPKLRSAAAYINNRRYSEAMQVLETMTDAERNGKWYFFATIASQGMGNIVAAQEYSQRAVALEPGNFQYHQLYQSLNYSSSSQWYSRQSSFYGYDRPIIGIARWCVGFALINLICNLLCCL